MIRVLVLEMSIMSNLKKPLERTKSLFELAWSPNPTWRMLFGLYFQAWSQLFPMGNGIWVLVCVLCIHCVFVFDDLPLWSCLIYSCYSIYEYCLINSHELSDVVNLVSVFGWYLCHFALEAGV